LVRITASPSRAPLVAEPCAREDPLGALDPPILALLTLGDQQARMPRRAGSSRARERGWCRWTSGPSWRWCALPTSCHARTWRSRALGARLTDDGRHAL